ALRELDQVQESSQQWKEAVAKVGTRPEQIFGLAELARKWGWQNEAIDLWWLAAKDPINAEKTLRMLYDFYADLRDTQELYRELRNFLIWAKKHICCRKRKSSSRRRS